MMMAVCPVGPVMVMCMGMGNSMGMGAAVMRMGKHMLMTVHMVPDQGVHDDEYCSHQHHRKCNQIYSGELFLQQ